MQLIRPDAVKSTNIGIKENITDELRKNRDENVEVVNGAMSFREFSSVNEKATKVGVDCSVCVFFIINIIHYFSN